MVIFHSYVSLPEGRLIRGKYKIIPVNTLQQQAAHWCCVGKATLDKCVWELGYEVGLQRASENLGSFISFFQMLWLISRYTVYICINIYIYNIIYICLYV